MKKLIFVFLVLLALFAAFIVLASSIRQVLMGEGGARTTRISISSSQTPSA